MKTGAVVLMLALSACATDDIIGPPDDAAAQRIAPRLAVIATAIAVVGEGAGVLDNFLPCGRRGIVNFHSTSSQTRSATFSGCELGDSIAVDGVADLYWSGARNQPLSGATTVTLLGDLTLTVAGQRSRVRELAITNIQFPDQFANPFRLRLDSMRIELNDQQFRATSLHSARNIIDPTLTPDAIPALALSALTDADMKRIAFDIGLGLGWYMATNVRSIDPGPTVIQTQCGLTHVQWDAQAARTFFRQEWHQCRVFGGVLISGNFDMRMPGPFQPTTTLQLVATDALTLSGAVPTITLTRFEWSLTVAGMPGLARISGTLQSQTQQRQYSFDVYVDD